MEDTKSRYSLDGPTGSPTPVGPSPFPTVAALYVLPRSHYHDMPAVECWPATRDATTYPGPHPVVAHPPCGHWGKYSAICRQPGRACAPLALTQVRTWGGVLEHPLGSSILRDPSRGSLDLWGGRIILVDQHRFGHKALKPTLLYFVRCEPPALPSPRSTPPCNFNDLSSRQRLITPPDFAAWLVAAAREAQK